MDTIVLSKYETVKIARHLDAFVRQTDSLACHLCAFEPMQKGELLDQSVRLTNATKGSSILIKLTELVLVASHARSVD